MGEEIDPKDKPQGMQQSGSVADPDKTVIDPNSPARREQAAGGPGGGADKTVIDPNSALLRAGIPADAESNAPGRSGTGTSALPPVAQAAAASALALPLGWRLHEYRLDGVLGQGGFGIAYLATDVNLNAKVAIKEYLPEDFAYRSSDRAVSVRSEDDRDFYQSGLDSFLVEARTLATIRHPNIVRVARFFEANKTAYMVLEYERGQSLKSWRKKHPKVSERELLTLLLPLLDGLAVVHETGFLHRDIKPDNIYVRDEDGSLVLLDFGAARQTAGGKSDLAIVVTPGYGPIEQYSTVGGDRQGPWTDLYALGATLFWLITGRKPIEATERIGKNDPMPPAEQLCKGQYSTEFLRAIDWALKPHPQDRPKDVAKFRNALYAAHASTLGLQEALRASEEGEAGAGKAGESWISVLRSPRLLKIRLIRVARGFTRPGSWPIAAKITLAMVFTALFPMLITAYYNLDGSLASVSSGELRNLEQLAQSTAGRISQLIGDSRNLATYLGTDDDFVDFLSKPPTEKGVAALKMKLEGLVKANPDVQFAMVMDPTGTAVVASDPQVMGKNFKFREYFKVAMEGRPFMTGIIVGAVAGAAGVFYSHPVFAPDSKTVIGAVVLRIKGEPIGKILAGIQQGQERIPFLVDDDGVIIWHPNEKLLYSSLVPLKKEVLAEIIADQRFRRQKIDTINQPDLAKVMVGAKQGGNVSYYSNIARREEIAGYAPVPEHDWVVGVTESRDYFAAPLNRLFRNVLYSVALVGLVFLLLARRVARTIVRPIETLNAAAHALKSGDYAKATIEVKTNDEIGQLARTFNVMIDVLRQRERERERAGRRAVVPAGEKKKP